MAISSASSTAARSTASTPATAFDGAFAGIETQTRVGLQTRGDDIHVGLFKHVAARRRSRPSARTTCGKTTSACGPIPRRAGPTGCAPRSASARIILPAGCRATRRKIPATRTASMTSPEGRHRSGAVVQDRVLRQCRLRPALQRHQGRDDHGRSQRQGDAAGPGAAAGPLEGRRDRHSHQGDRRSHQFAGAVRARFRFRTAVRRRRRHHRASRPSRRVGVEWTNQYKSLPWMTFDLDVAYTRARFTDFDPAGDLIPGAPAWIASGGVTFGARHRLVRRAARALFRAAAADRGRQRAFAERR